MTKPSRQTATMISTTTTTQAAFDLPGASIVCDVCARRASSSASAAAVERTPDTPDEPKPLTPEMPVPLPPMVPPLVRMLGSDGIDGSELECTPLPDFDPGPLPGLVPPVRDRILRSPSVGVNSLMTLSTRESVTIFLAFDRKAK